MTSFPPIAIVGLGCVIPGAHSPQALWRLAERGDVVYGPMPAGRFRADRDRLLVPSADWRPGMEGMVSDHAGYVADFHASEEPAFVGLEAMHHWLFDCGRQALGQARIAGAALERTGAIIGNLCYPTEGLSRFAEQVWLGAPTTRAQNLRNQDLRNQDPRNRFASGYPAHLLCARLQLGAGGFALDAACASSLYAIKLAADWLEDGKADVMLAGGVNGADFLGLNMGFSALNALSPSGRSRPFNVEADGLLAAEGAALLALKRLADARRDGDDILGVIRGVGLGNDGAAGGFLAPAQEGQRRAIAEAYAASGIDPDRVSYLECHATGTARGDGVEVSAAAEFFGGRDLVIGSLKANIGHLATAAGAAGLIKAVMAMRNRVLPPTPNAFPNIPQIAESRFRVSEHPRDWEATTPRVACVSAFGFGGNNAHLIVEEGAGVEAPKQTAKASAPVIAVVGVGLHAGADETADAVRRRLFLGDAPPPRPAAEIELPLSGLRFPPHDLACALPQQLLMTRVALEAIGADRHLPQRMSALIGMGCDPNAARANFRARLPSLETDARADAIPPLTAAAVIGAMANVLANRLNANFDLRGPSYAVAAEEASGLRALDIALRALRKGEIDAALVGAVDLSDEPVHRAAALLLCAEPPPAGDAACAILLKRKDDAERDGDPILACFDDDARVDRLEWGPYEARRRACFGLAHAADGLFSVACAILALQEGVLPPTQGRKAAPWLRPRAGRAARLRPGAIGAEPQSVTLHAGDAPAPALVASPLVIAYGGADWAALRRAVDADAACDPKDLPEGPRCVVFAQMDRSAARAAIAAFLAAKEAGERPAPPPPGIAFSEGAMGGEAALVFTGAAAGYPGMGRDLLVAYPALLSPILEDAGSALASANWMFDDTARRAPDDFAQLVGASLLCQAHAAFARLIGLVPDAAIGLSSGETNALFALGAWEGLEELFASIHRSGLYTSVLGGSYEAVRQHWSQRGLAGESWANFGVRASRAEIEELIRGEPAVHLLTVNSPVEAVIGGEEAACERIAERLGPGRAARLDLALAVHCPEVAACAELWRRLHHRPTRAPEKTRFYFNATGTASRLDADTVADALLAQAFSTVDFPRTIRRAWADGVRIFVECGPRAQCSRWIRESLEGRPHLAVAFDDYGRSSLTQAYHAIATLLAAGVRLDLDRIAPAATSRAEQPTQSFAAHAPPIDIRHAPALVPRPQIMEPPGPAPIFRASQCETGPSDDSLGHSLLRGHAALTQAHTWFMRSAAQAEARFQALVLAAAGAGSDRDTTRPDAAADCAPSREAEKDATPRGLQLDRRQLEYLASGKISEIFGPLFARQDDYARQVRMPQPPLLLVDRVTGIEGDAGTMGCGTIWTETDVPSDAWYLHDGRMPTGVVIESGQADLLLISWLGADFHNRGERVYRLLGCEMTLFGELPAVGDILRYDIHVDGHARTGETALFFFHYDLTIDGETRLRVRNGQAGFFTDAELAQAQGVLWSAETGAHKADDAARVDSPRIACAKRSFSTEDVRACSEGAISAAFGPGYELTQSHTRTPRLQSGRMLLLQNIPVCDPRGGPWKRGYLRAEWRVSPDDWFFEGHFKNDPCMPGTLMLEACVQAMSFYLIFLGLTVERDGWRFEPAQERGYQLQCRSQVVPASRLVTYEIFVEEVIAGPIPMLIADVLGSVDGVGAVHCHGFALRLVPDWPLDDRLLARTTAPETKAVAFDHAALLACALGRPARALPVYDAQHEARRVPRLPGPPFHCMSRVIRVTGEMGSGRPGAIVEAEYDSPPDAWYFSANGASVMPFGLLLETALQPCGWLASYCGFAAQAEEELSFRNLDGVATIHREATPDVGVLSTRAELVEVSRIGSMVIVSFAIIVSSADGPLMEARSTFGFFPATALAEQIGLPASEDERLAMEAPSDVCFDLTSLPPALFSGSATLARAPLLMMDRITDWRLTGGRFGCGRIRAEKEVTPGEWFFKAHFYQDPVQPGSLGLEALLQLLQAHMLLAGMAHGLAQPRFEPIASGDEAIWKYRGQVLPTNGKVTLLLDIVETETSPHRIVTRAAGSLWVDGKKIYEAQKLAMALRDSTVGAEYDAILEDVIDRKKARWIEDHCPTFVLPTVPLAWLVDLMARCALSARPGATLVALTDVFVTRWLVVEDTLRLTARILRSDDVSLEIVVDAAAKGAAPIRAAAQGTALFETLRATPEPLRVDGLGPPVAGASLYEEGLLFHGPALQSLVELRRGVDGAVARLEAGPLGTPQGVLNPSLLDGMFQIPHDQHAGAWSGVSPGLGAFPSKIDRLDFFGPAPMSDVYECRVKRAPADSDKLVFEAQLVAEDRVLMAATIRYVAMPLQPVEGFSIAEQKRFLAQAEHVPGFALGRCGEHETLVSPAHIGAADWLPGTVAAAYGCARVTGLDLLEAVAVKQHVAAKVGVHPSAVTLDRAGPRCERLPYNRFSLDVTATRDGVRVRDLQTPHLDLDAARAYWARRHRSEHSLMAAIAIEQVARFVRKFEICGADTLSALHGRGALFLANHQTYQEGASFSLLASTLFDAPVRVLVKSEHRDDWVGALDRFACEEPGGRIAENLFYFDRSTPQSIFDIIEEFAELQKQGPHSLLVFVEGERMLAAGQKVSRVSTLLPDIALRLHLPIAPLRISGGLPREPRGEKYEFPFDWGKQDFVVGPVIEPEEIARLTLKERTMRIIDAIDALPPGPDERPLPNDPRFIAAVERRVIARGPGRLNLVKATFTELLLGMEPNEATTPIIEALGPRRWLLDDAWTQSFYAWLTGDEDR